MQSFTYYYETLGEYGEVDQVNIPVVIAKGLPNVRLKELVLFETGQTGWVTALNPKDVEILLLTQEKIPVGTKIVRTMQVLSIPVGDYAIGRTINPLGHPVDGNFAIPPDTQARPIDSRPKGIK